LHNLRYHLEYASPAFDDGMLLSSKVHTIVMLALQITASEAPSNQQTNLTTVSPVNNSIVYEYDSR